MHVAIALIGAFAIAALLIFVVGLTAPLAVPLVIIGLVVVFYGPALLAAAGQRHTRNPGVPTTEEASYEPRVDPGDRP
jgi:hypothetical protein